MSETYETQNQPSGWAMGWATFADPVWAIFAIAVDIAIIWALTAQGRDLAER